MMQTSEDWESHDPCANGGIVARARNWDLLSEPLMRSSLLELRDVFFNYGPQTSLAQDDEMIETLAPVAAEEALAGGVHQRRSHCRFQEADTRSSCDAVEVRAKLGGAIANDELWRLIVRLAMQMPSCRSSPRMRSAPERRLSRAICRMSAMVS